MIFGRFYLRIAAMAAAHGSIALSFATSFPAAGKAATAIGYPKLLCANGAVVAIGVGNPSAMAHPAAEAYSSIPLARVPGQLSRADALKGSQSTRRILHQKHQSWTLK